MAAIDDINNPVRKPGEFYIQAVGGDITDVNEFPHMTAIGSREGETIFWQCGASLISKKFIVTAAHCAPRSTKVASTVVRIGDKNLNDEFDGAEPEEFGIKRVIVHPDYKRSTKYNDIALFELDGEVE